MIKKIKILFVLSVLPSLFGCLNSQNQSKQGENELVDSQLKHAEKQITLLLSKATEEGAIPRTVANGKIHWANKNFDWTEGFFPGTCWYLFEATNDVKWKLAAENLQSKFKNNMLNTTNHDLGFVFNCSYGNGYRLTKNKDFIKVIVTAAESLITRFNPAVGAIKSWNVDKGWQSKRDWKYPVIIDNMMNLEILFKASELTGNPKYRNVAITHANTTLKNHFRGDNSSYHVVDYDPESGQVRKKETAQGYANESAWARGQAWGIYGYTVCYRYTKDKKYLDQAEKIAAFIMNNKKIPEDEIPYWDYNAPDIPNEPRDVSAAAITTSALVELNTFSSKNYKPYIDKLLASLSSDKYLSEVGENNYFLLKHSVGSIPHNNEIDVPLSYADYYYVEALVRLRDLQRNKK